MAEFVELRCERWVPELEHLEKLKLFTLDEVRKIKKRKREFELRLERDTKTKRDYMQYIQYELSLYKTVRARKERMGITSKKPDNEKADAKRILKLYRQVIDKYPDDMKLWSAFFKFCQEVGFETSVGKGLTKMVQLNSHNVDFWIFAAKWELKERKVVEDARQFLLKGMRYHPESRVLYEEFFQLELEFAKIKLLEKQGKIKKISRDKLTNEATENVIKYNLAETTYDFAIKKISGIDFKIQLLSLAKSYPKTTDLQNKIIKDLLENHSQDELTWDTLAKREMEGLVYKDLDLLFDSEPFEIDVERETKGNSRKKKIQRSVNVYKEAVKKLNTVRMWSLYLDHLIELNSNAASMPIFKAKLLRIGMEGALASGHMDEKYFLFWIDTLLKTGKFTKLAEVLERATELHPKNAKLWHTRLRFHLTRNQETQGLAVFKEACVKLGNDLPLWKLVIQFLQTKSTTKVEELFLDGLAKGGDIAQGLKPLYIEWLVLTKGMGYARRIFETQQLQYPPCLELIKKMASLESVQPDTNMKAIRRCHDLACTHFGSNNVDVWLEFIRFEMKFGEPPKVCLIYQRAMKELDNVLADQFALEYNSFKTAL